MNGLFVCGDVWCSVWVSYFLLVFVWLRISSGRLCLWIFVMCLSMVVMCVLLVLSVVNVIVFGFGVCMCVVGVGGVMVMVVFCVFGNL